VKGSLLAVIVLAVVIASAGAIAFALGPISSDSHVENVVSNPGCVKTEGGYLIVASDSGFNDSSVHLQADPSQPYPLITVAQGSNVTITVCTTSKVEMHGFAIDYYFPVGKVLAPKDSFTVTFQAEKTGIFSIYCNVLCPIHEWMLQGELVVT
jgi:hypothetical protein